MVEALVITPVKNSLETTLLTLNSVCGANGNFKYIIYNDFSNEHTKKTLESQNKDKRFELIHLEDLTTNPSPNYKLVLLHSQNLANTLQVPLIIIESDVVIKTDTIENLLGKYRSLAKPGLIGVITVDKNGEYNFPYNEIKKDNLSVIKTNRSLSFCCTLISKEFLENYSFENLSQKKHWFDIYISRKSKYLGFNNYLVKDNEVLHLPHSSRPWKQLKYTNPVKYYILKILNKRDRI